MIGDIFQILGQMAGEALNNNAKGMVAGKANTAKPALNQPYGMKMQTGPTVDRGASDVSTPGHAFFAMDPINSKMSAGTVNGMKDEADLYAPGGPTTGGFMAQPLNVNSSQAIQPAFNSNMPAYLNYMKYRGGQ